MTGQRVEVGSAWGKAIGYSRAVRAGNMIVVSGTSASAPDGSMLHPGDAESQTRVVLERIVGALNELSAGPEHVIETRIFLKRMEDWEKVGRVHGEIFGAIRPATTMVQAGALIHDEMLVEIAATAVLQGRTETRRISQ
jgi:enamine deaminase RidA (YjgF/YER057c/UK114 family)